MAQPILSAENFNLWYFTGISGAIACSLLIMGMLIEAYATFATALFVALPLELLSILLFVVAFVSLSVIGTMALAFCVSPSVETSTGEQTIIITHEEADIAEDTLEHAVAP